MLAAELGYPQITQIFLDAKADLNSQNSYWNTVLYLAALNRLDDTARLLIENGVNRITCAGQVEG